ncbi:hypothetical protein [Celeribacter marinus]|uniref:Uncharacterized protein n=1 Tax=Celeribacter marinus TaxID=1397108 RepID=A0A0P0AD43_9RHOB|nr:hypothetical protein [Celeribacter marinus]ALI56887.1 hypothetical protein IMCC12053_2940 [Celeribacter marinus]SFK98028.1 hypothetical protein SAMN05444421_1124 [Celeribacter marinus]
MTVKKKILCAIPHSPAFDSCFPLLERLHQRGRIEPYVLLGPRLKKVEPRAEIALRNAGLRYKAVSLLRLEVLSAIDILRADAVLTHSDPRAYGGKFRPRDSVTLGLKKPTIFVQHGMVQAGLHYGGSKRVWDFHADLILTWKPLPDPHATFFGTDVADRIRVTGLIKTNRLARSAAFADLSRELSHWRQRLLICHNFGFESPLYPISAQRRAFDEWANVADSRPDTLFIVRSHRGKSHPENTALVEKLVQGRPNILLSERHAGLMRMATINDVMTVVDRVISHPSTVVLDAIYDDKPVGVYNSIQPELSCLPRAETAAEISAFLDDPNGAQHAAPIRDLYGEVSDNLDIAAHEVESHLIKM